jgi:hypothetical protein
MVNITARCEGDEDKIYDEVLLGYQPADSPRELHHTQSLGKQQISG